MKWKDSKVFKIPSELKTDKLLQLCMETIQRHDVRHIRTLHTKDNKIYETWYYGKTKVENLETSSIELLAAKVASPNPESLTGLLAELGHTLSEKLSRETLSKKPVQIINLAIKDSIIQRSNLLSYCNLDSVIQRSQILSNKGPKI